MAIKERKQITGTTEQINAYAGHEGQIVWDKDKKTFVGMSGTAGTNYPLAQQAYVDTQFLPLTGGELTGSLVAKGMSAGGSSASIYTTDPSTELMITTGNADFTKGGGALALYGRDHEMQGGWALLARSRDDDIITLSGNPTTRRLLWGGQIVDSIVQEHVLGSDGFIKYASGYQIVWGTSSYGAGDLQPITLTTPFSNSEFTVAVNCLNTYGFWITQARNPNRFLGFAVEPGKGHISGYLIYTAFGRWK